MLDRTRVLPAERVTLAESVGRVLAEDVIAEGPLPAFRSSAVDGYAVRASDAGKTLRVLGESAAGRPFAGEIGPGARPPHEICDFAGTPDGAEAGVKGPGVASSRIYRCAPSRATLSLAPAADAANLRRTSGGGH